MAMTSFPALRLRAFLCAPFVPLGLMLTACGASLVTPTTDAGAAASLPSTDAGRDAPSDGTLLDGSVLDDGSTTADASNDASADGNAGPTILSLAETRGARSPSWPS
jgi:hypothetical protein